jgi:tRNA nucleotidyltransferase/poly(A) polymerase
MRTASQHETQVALMRFLSQVATRLGVGEHVYVVGGAVRDFVLDKPIKDVDVVLDVVALGAKRDSEWFAKEVQKQVYAPTSLATNQYGVAILTIKSTFMFQGVDLGGETIEIANSRKESYGGEGGAGYKPHMVEPATIEEDVLRREFNFNSLLWRLQDLANGPEKAEVVDLTGCGLRDLREGVMSCPRDPNIVFSDDPTRMIRLLKFVGRYGFKVPPDVAAAVRRNAKALKNAPPAAVVNIVVNDVLLKPYARKVLPLMEDLGLTAVIQELMQVDKQFKSTMLNAAFEMPPQLVADLLGYGFESFRPRFLKPHQVALYQKIIGSMSPEDAETFDSLMELPPVSNIKYINMFSLKGPDRALPAEYAREALLADPDLDRWRAGVLDEVVLARFNQVRGLVAAWGAPLFKGE